MKRLGIIIPAGGNGARMGSGANGRGDGALPKQFRLLAGKPVLTRTLEAFAGVATGADIVVALPEEHIETWRALCGTYPAPPHKVCAGGACRFASVRAALAELPLDCDFIAVHDAARPLVSGELIVRAIETAHTHGTAIPVVEPVDSLRRLTPGGGSHPVPRAEFRAVQTPQIFRHDILRTAYELAVGEDFTDEGSVAETAGYTVELCEGERQNIKLTLPADFAVAEAILAQKQQALWV